MSGIDILLKKKKNFYMRNLIGILIGIGLSSIVPASSKHLNSLIDFLTWSL